MQGEDDGQASRPSIAIGQQLRPLGAKIQGAHARERRERDECREAHEQLEPPG